MISKFVTVYPGHIDLPDMGQDATPANERRYSNEQLAAVFEKTEAVAKKMDALGFDTLWLAEHHFQHEGYEVMPNLLMLAVHLAHVTKRLRIGCGFNIAPMWHPLRLAEDYAVADILTKGRTVFGVGRGYHTREVETFGAPHAGPGRQPRAVRGAGGDHLQGVQQRALLAQGQALHAAAGRCPIAATSSRSSRWCRGRSTGRSSAGSRSSAPARAALDFMVGTTSRAPSAAARRPWPRGRSRPTGTRRRAPARTEARREPHRRHLLPPRRQTASRRSARSRPIYEEHVKMFAPLGFVPGITPAQVEAVARRGGWDAAGVPTLEHYMKTRRLVRRHAGRADRAPEEAGGALSRHAAHQPAAPAWARRRP